MGVTWATRPAGVSTYPFVVREVEWEPTGFRVHGQITSRLMRLFPASDPGWAYCPDEEADSVMPNTDEAHGDLDLTDAVRRITGKGDVEMGDGDKSYHVVGVNTVKLFNDLADDPGRWDVQDEVDRGGRYDKRSPT